ncbi:MAG: hypothetical protein ACNYPE_13810, partial [Candidatus Azotimanducaceae bacterium WSBS_2022_MAG_OTU7]
ACCLKDAEKAVVIISASKLKIRGDNYRAQGTGIERLWGFRMIALFAVLKLYYLEHFGERLKACCRLL